jgi:hypothetical protein
MPKFKVGDKVVLKSKEELTRPWYKGQECGIGTILKTELTSFEVKWTNGHIHTYLSQDLILKEDLPMTRTIPTKDQVLKAATSCPQTKETLKILFPEDFKKEFDWDRFKRDPFTQLLVVTEHNQIIPSERLKEVYRAKGTPIPMSYYPNMTLNIITKLFDFLNRNAGE